MVVRGCGSIGFVGHVCCKVTICSRVELEVGVGFVGHACFKVLIGSRVELKVGVGFGCETCRGLNGLFTRGFGGATDCGMGIQNSWAPKYLVSMVATGFAGYKGIFLKGRIERCEGMTISVCDLERGSSREGKIRQV